MKICYIVGAGDYSGRFVPMSDTYIIAADAGYKVLKENSIEPNLVVGDFDSMGEMPKHPNIIAVLAEKNETDMSLAIRHGLEHGCNVFIIDGGIGGRLDHTIANIQLLKEIRQNKAHGILLGCDTCITAITNETLKFAAGATGIISVFTIGEIAEGVTLDGLKYPLNYYTMTDNNPIGVSNEFTGKPATVSVQSGTVIVTWAEAPVTITFENGEQITI